MPRIFINRRELADLNVMFSVFDIQECCAKVLSSSSLRQEKQEAELELVRK